MSCACRFADPIYFGNQSNVFNSSELVGDGCVYLYAQWGSEGTGTGVLGYWVSQVPLRLCSCIDHT